MKEIFEIIKTNAKKFAKENQELNQMNEELIKYLELRDKKRAEIKQINEKESGFYKDTERELEIVEKYMSRLRNKCLEISKEAEEEIAIERTKIVEELSEQLRFIDKNRHINLREVDMEALEKEKIRLQSSIKIIFIDNDQYSDLSYTNKRKVQNAEENIARNARILKKIEEINDFIKLLDGKEAKEKYIEISQIKKEVEEKFNIYRINELEEFVIQCEEKANNVAEKQEKQQIDKKEIKKVDEKEKEIEKEKSISIKFDNVKGCFIIKDEDYIESEKIQEIKPEKIGTENKQKLERYILRKYKLNENQMQRIDMDVASILLVYDKNKKADKLDKYITTLMSENKKEECYDEELKKHNINIDIQTKDSYRKKAELPSIREKFNMICQKNQEKKDLKDSNTSNLKTEKNNVREFKQQYRNTIDDEQEITRTIAQEAINIVNQNKEEIQSIE